MIERVETLFPGLRRFSRFGVVGVLQNASVYLLFLAMIGLGVAPLFASGFCYVLGVTISYLLNRRWTFASQSTHTRDLPRFLAAYGGGLAVTLISMSLLIPLLGPALAQLVTIGIAAVSIYAFLCLLRFGHHG